MNQLVLIGFRRLMIVLAVAISGGLAAAEPVSTINIDKTVLGKTFSIVGPNCFSTALRVRGFTPTFRGVDFKEFDAFVRNFCVPVEIPEPGDIGTYSVKDYEFLHAFVYVNETTGIEKGGVDYAGPWAIAENSIVNIDYTRIASPECRRYSPDISLCSNKKQYYRCSQPTFPSDSKIEAHNANVLAVELAMQSLIEQTLPHHQQYKTYSSLKAQLKKLVTEVDEISKLDINPPLKYYFSERVQSLLEQQKFIDIYFSNKRATEFIN